MTDLVYYDDTIEDDGYAALSQSMQYSNVLFGDYYRTLLGEALRCGYFDKEFGDASRRDLGNALASLITEFTGGESTSVLQDTANELFASILYNLDVRLMFESSHSKALALIAEKDVPELYYEGQKLVERLVVESVGLLVKARSTRIAVSDKSYDAMLDGEIKSWIYRYDKRFFAHRTRRSSGYQTCLGCGRLRGILYVKKYLENLIAENKYVNKFDPDAIGELCFDYALARGNEYNNTGSNVFSLVLLNQTVRYISGEEDRDVVLRSHNVRDAVRRLRKLQDGEMRSLVADSLAFITDDAYVSKCSNIIWRRIDEAVKNNRLKEIVSVGHDNI